MLFVHIWTLQATLRDSLSFSIPFGQTQNVRSTYLNYKKRSKSLIDEKNHPKLFSHSRELLYFTKNDKQYLYQPGCMNEYWAMLYLRKTRHSSINGANERNSESFPHRKFFLIKYDYMKKIYFRLFEYSWNL